MGKAENARVVIVYRSQIAEEDARNGIPLKPAEYAPSAR